MTDTENDMNTEPIETQAVVVAEPAKQEPLPMVKAQPMTPTEARDESVNKLMASALSKAGTLVLTPEESKALAADFPDEAFQPGAAGKENLIYIEHAALRDRFNSVLGLGQWVPVVRESWKEEWTTSKNDPAITVYSRVMLVVRGCYVGEAVGDMDYFPKNRAQNYGDAFEGAKTAGLRRCAKEFGVGLQAWRKDWCLGWWERRKRPISRSAPRPPSEPHQPVKVAKTASGGTQAGQNTAMVGALKQRIEKLKASLGPKLEYATAYLRVFTAQGSDQGASLMPNEDVSDLSETSVDWLAHNWADFIKRLDAYIEDQGGLGPVVDPDVTQVVPRSAVDAAIRQAELAANPTVAPAVPDEDRWFWDIILTVPPRGSKKAEYNKRPDTIRSLYDAMKDGDETAKSRLWGLAKQWNPEPYTAANGKVYQPTDADWKARKALDAFVLAEEGKEKL